MTEKPTPSRTRASTGTGTTRRATGTATRATSGSGTAGSRTRSAGSAKAAREGSPSTRSTPAAKPAPAPRSSRKATAPAPRPGASDSGTRPASAKAAVAASRSRGSTGLDRSGTAHGHSAVEALLAAHVGPAQHEPQPVRQPATPSPRTRPSGTDAPALAPLPPAQDVLLGLASLMAEHAWRWGTHAVAAASGATARTVAFVRGVAPGYASVQVESRLDALAERGRRVRQERAEALGTAVTAAVTTAATSDAVREMTVAAIEQATDDVLAVILPAALEAVAEVETQERLDELMAGLLLRQLPSALERTLPGVMLRTATRPALGLVPFLGGSAPRGQ